MGYKEWRAFFEGKKSETEVLKEWINEETKYVKRQIVWFKKDERIHWFNITSADYPENVEKIVEKWDNTHDA
jgi:tRNA dimethylallyltransferase